MCAPKYRYLSAETELRRGVAEYSGASKMMRPSLIMFNEAAAVGGCESILRYHWQAINISPHAGGILRRFFGEKYNIIISPGRASMLTGSDCRLNYAIQTGAGRGRSGADSWRRYCGQAAFSRRAHRESRAAFVPPPLSGRIGLGGGSHTSASWRRADGLAAVAQASSRTR